MSACPSRVILEQYLLTPWDVAERSHIEGCGHCQGRLQDAIRVGDEFHQWVYPATVTSLPSQPPVRGYLKVQWWLPAAVALVASVMFIALPTTQVPKAAPSWDNFGTKGEAFQLQVFVEDRDRVIAATEGESVRGLSRWRSAIRTSSPCTLWLFSVDASGTLSRLYPIQGEHGAEIAASGELPGGAQLDALPGPERIVAICGDEGLTWSSVRDCAKRSFAPKGAEAVRRSRELTCLPRGTQQSSVLLEKTQ